MAAVILSTLAFFLGHLTSYRFSVAGLVSRPFSAPQAVSPDVAVYVVVLFEVEFLAENKDFNGTQLHGGYSWLENLLITRHYNPDLRITMLVDNLEAVTANQTVLELLDAASITLARIQQYNASHSRAAHLRNKAPDYFQHFFERFTPNLECNGHMHDSCGTMVHFWMDMLARFCWQADLSKEELPAYVITMDADIMLTESFTEAFQELMVSTEVLTLSEWSSQFVVWRRDRLDQFCDAMVQHADMGRDDQLAVFTAGTQYLPFDAWTDMTFLAGYLRIMYPETSRTVLCGTPSAWGYNFRCTRLKWQVGVGLAWMADDHSKLHYMYSLNRDCSNTTDFVEWRQGIIGPELWARWQNYPEKTGPAERVPIAHWNWPFGCKRVGSQHYRDQFASAGLLPYL